MKRVVAVILAVLLTFALTACKSKQKGNPLLEKAMESVGETQPTTQQPEINEEEPAQEHNIKDSEEISKTISRVITLINNAKECNNIYTGNLTVNKDLPSQYADGEAEYFYLEDYNAINEIDALWKDTFTSTSKGRAFYDKIGERMQFVSFNGELHMKTGEDIPPMTMGEWDTNSIVIKEVEQSKALIEMNATLEGSSLGVKTLELEKQGGKWLLNDSYFLD